MNKNSDLSSSGGGNKAEADAGRVSSRVVDDYSATYTTTGAVTVGATVYGSIESTYDEDWFKVYLLAGQSYQIDLIGDSWALDPYLSVFSGFGVGLAYDDDSGLGYDSSLTFQPTSSGYYYISASDRWWTGTGNYHIVVTNTTVTPSVDDYLATTATTGVANTNTVVRGVINAAGDHDWFKITLTAGTSYTISLNSNVSASNPLSDPYFYGISDAAGVFISGTSNDDYYGLGRNSQVTFIPSSTGVYFLDAGGYGLATGAYQLSVTAQVLTDVAANTSTTAAVTVGGRYSGLINSISDVDWIRATLTAGTTYVIELNSDTAASNALSDPYLVGVYSASGILLSGTTNDDYGISLNSRVIFTPGASGTYYIAADGVGAAVGAYQLALSTSTLGSDAEGDDTSTASAMSVGTAQTGRIDFSRDVDWFRVGLTAGQTYQVTARGSQSGSGSLLDPKIVAIYDGSGTALAGTGNDDTAMSLDAATTFTAQTAGNYYIAVSAADDGTGTYTVNTTVASGGSDWAANASTTGQLSVGGNISSQIDQVGDVDWVALTLTAGRTYQISMLGQATSSGTLSDPVIFGVYDASGSVLNQTQDDDSGTGSNAQIQFTANQSGTYYLSVGAYGGNTGSYQLTMTATGVDATAPTLLATWPADDEVSVDPRANLSLEFSESVMAGSGNIILTGGGSTRTIAVTDTSQVSFHGSTMSINPTADLATNTTYTVTWGAGVVKDLSGNAFAGVTSTSQFNFKTANASSAETWTIMVYMAADNNLENFGLDDVNEMESVNLPSNVNVVVLLDRAGGYDTSNGNWTDTRVGVISHDDDVYTINSNLVSQGESNTGAGATLTQFINSTVASNPASHYALIVWDHGGGLSGTSWDESSSNDNLTLSEFASAVDASVVNTFDFIGFDACLQGMVEQAWDVRNLTDVLVSSQELIPGDGWEYHDFLNALVLDSHASAYDLAHAAVDMYAERYAGVLDTTLSAVRTNGLDALKVALNNFTVTAINAGSTSLAALLSAAARATEIDNGEEDYRDLGNFMLQVISELPGTAIANAAQQVMTALDQAIISATGTVAGAQGLSVYLPTYMLDASYDMQSFSFLQSTGWGNFLRFLLGDVRNDRLIGNAEANNIMGFGGNDYMEGAAGHDSLDGGVGADTMLGGLGNDTYHMRQTGDVVTELSGAGTDLVYSYLSSYTLAANVENARAEVGTAANLMGNSLNNILYAGTGANVLNGGAGVDTVSYAYGVTGTTGVTVSLAVATAQATGGSGSDTLSNIERLTGSAYADQLSGNSGNNVLTGGAGKDTLRGNGGNDTFDFNALSDSGVTSSTRDVIADFNAGDKIDLSTLDANAATSANDAFAGLIASSASFTQAGQLRFTAGVLYGNTDADSAAEFSIALTGVSQLWLGALVL